MGCVRNLHMISVERTAYNHNRNSCVGWQNEYVHLLSQPWSPFDFCFHTHSSDRFQVFTDGSLLAILILPIILAFFCWTMRPVATRDTAIEAGNHHNHHKYLSLQPQKMCLRGGPNLWFQKFLPLPLPLPKIFLWSPTLLHGLCRLQPLLLVSLWPLLRPLGVAEKEGWSYGMPLPSVEVLDLDVDMDWMGESGLACTSLRSRGAEGGTTMDCQQSLGADEIAIGITTLYQFHTMGLLLYVVFHHHTLNFLSFQLYGLYANHELIGGFKDFFIFSPLIYLGKMFPMFTSIIFSDGLVKNHRSSEPSKLLHLTVALPSGEGLDLGGGFHDSVFIYGNKSNINGCLLVPLTRVVDDI